MKKCIGLYSVISLLIVLPSLSACKENANVEDAPKPQVQKIVDKKQDLSLMGADTLKQEIEKMTNNKSCISKESCQSVGMGHRPCGGPEHFTVFSTDNMSLGVLKPYIDRYNTLRREAVSKSGVMGICVAAQPPTLVCENQVCVAKPKATGLSL
ncbi:MAG: hypothetical protein AAGB12_03460 [Pseudomonadota bacterium]